MKNKKTWLMLSVVCIVLGIIVLTAGRILGGRPGFYIDRSGIHTSGDKGLPESVGDSIILEEFNGIELDVEYADVEIVTSDRFAVDYCIAGEYGEPVCEVKNGTFVFKEKTQVRMWNFGVFTGYIGVFADEPGYYVRIEVPAEREFEKIVLNVEEGRITLPSVYADELEIDNVYGDVAMEKYTGKRLKVNMEDGALSVDVALADRMEFVNEYGNILIGQVVGENLSSKAEDGELRINSLEVNKAEVQNEYGDVRLGLAGDIYEYGYNLKTEYGYISMADGKWERSYEDEGMEYRSEGSKTKKIEVSCEDGNIEIFQSKKIGL